MRPEMPKQAIHIAELVKQFETHSRLEGKPETTCHWYRDILRRFLGWAGDITVEDFTIEQVREYLAYAKDRPRYDGHPTTPSDGRIVSAHTFRHHAVTLRVFSRWLRDEGYTGTHRLERLKTPQIPEKVVEVLSAEEIAQLLACQPTNASHGSRNHALLVLALDTGLRMSELITLERRRVDVEKGVLTATGKGSK
jgi:integrase/recombinase XerD